MAVQEYLMDEMQDIVQDEEKAAEWTTMVNQLGLEGQLNLCTAKDNPIPFPLMNQSYQNVFKTLCPVAVEISKFNKMTIPLRVLALIALCREKEYFGNLQVWDDEQDLDPIIVGCDGSDKYLIARWGDELEEFGVLRAKAIELKSQQRENQLNKSILEDRQKLAVNVQDVTEFMMGRSSYLY